MSKYLLINKSTDLLLAVDRSAQIIQLLSKGFDGVVIRHLDIGHPFYNQANKTMMAQKLITVSSNLSMKDQTLNPFPSEVIGMLEIVKLREPIISRLFRMVANMVSNSSQLLFPGMESIIEIELRDCDHSSGIYTPNIHFHAEMLGIMPNEAYDQLNQMAATQQRIRMQGMSFVYKYSKMANGIMNIADAERINALMYEEWSTFNEQLTKEKS